MSSQLNPDPLWKILFEGAKRLPPILLVGILLIIALIAAYIFAPGSLGDVRWWMLFFAFAIIAEIIREWLTRKAISASDATNPPEERPLETSPPTLNIQSNDVTNIQQGGTLIVTVTKVEARAVLKVFAEAAGKNWQRKQIENKTYYDLGVHGAVPVFMVQSEMGSVTPGGATMTVYRAIESLNPQAVIMCGIAFGLDPDKQQLGDILISKQLQFYEPQKVDVQRGQIPRGDRVTASERLLDRFRSGDNDWQGAKTHFGLVFSGEKLVNDPIFRGWLLKNEPEAIGGEMEGSGLYVAARDAKVDWILVKAICDWADGKKNDNAQQLAAHNAASFVLHVLKLGGWAPLEQPSSVKNHLSPKTPNFPEPLEPISNSLKTEINAFEILLNKNLSDGARRYIELREKPEPEWQKNEVRAAVNKVWQEISPVELRDLVTLWSTHGNEHKYQQTYQQISNKNAQVSMSWALDGNVDEDWEQRACELVVFSVEQQLLEGHYGELLLKVEKRTWQAMLKIWPDLSFWETYYSPPSDDIIKGLDILGLKINPFGSEQAETDVLLINGYYTDLPELREMRKSEYPTLIVGTKGAGKTASALWLMQSTLQANQPSPRMFPVYFRTPAVPELFEAANIIAQTLLRYLAIHSKGFNNLRISERQSIVNLFSSYIGKEENILAQLRAAGLPSTGPGYEMEQEIRKLTKGLVLKTPLPRDEALRILRESSPSGFSGIRFLIDWVSPDQPSSEEINSIITLLDDLHKARIYGMFFFPFPCNKDTAKIMNLQWTDQHLRGLLRMRLAAATEDSLANWCNPLARQQHPDERLIRLVNTPADMINQGNQLLARIGKNENLLTAKDLDEIFGPY